MAAESKSLLCAVSIIGIGLIGDFCCVEVNINSATVANLSRAESSEMHSSALTSFRFVDLLLAIGRFEGPPSCEMDPEPRLRPIPSNSLLNISTFFETRQDLRKVDSL